MTNTATAARYRIRQATEAEFETVGRLTYEGFGHHLPDEPLPSPERLTLLLDTALRNERSQMLYRRFGFVRRPEREKPRPLPQVQLVVYTLDLPTT
jgi:ribosomal protein S18 acetylase RimI-like enzyme